MIGLESRILSEESARPNVTIAITACAISLFLHLILVLALSNMDFGIATSGVKPKKQRAPTIQLRDVRRDTPTDLSIPAFQKPGDPTLVVDLPRQTEILGVPPDQVRIEPPALPQDRLAGELGIVAEPSAVPHRSDWEPRQEIMAIENQIAVEKQGALERKKIPSLDRVTDAPDFVLPIDRDMSGLADSESGAGGGKGDAAFDSDRLSRIDTDKFGTGGGEGWGRRAPFSSLVLEKRTNLPPELKGLDEDENKGFRAIEKYLKAEMTTYEPLTDPAYGYFRIGIERLGPDILPVIPKDVLLVQDCSASMTDQRLYFCTNGLVKCLSEIGPDDRFNVVSFRETAEMCFGSWAPNTPENIAAAKEYIGKIRASGNTDIYSSLKELLKVNPAPGRPVIALLLSDGQPTIGMTRSSDVIAEFSRLNAGRISIFSMGTIQTANAYLLDLLSYCDRGDSFVVTSGRWDIPRYAQSLARETSRPVLSDTKFYFAGGSAVEAYPYQTSNLYLDRQLVLFGRYRRGTEKIVFRSTGRAGDVDCDMVFELPVEGAKRGEKGIRTDWAKQKIYTLISRYAERPDTKLMDEIKAVAKAHRITVPYGGRFDK